MELHEACEPLRHLLGTWRGGGEGSYPTIEPFGYTEEVTFGHVGKPFIAYQQKTRHAETGLPLHAESGYFRPTGPTTFELVIVQPSGIFESHLGVIDGASLTAQTEHVHCAPTAVEVTAVERSFVVAGSALTIECSMEAVGQPMTHHLRSVLERE